MGSLNTQTIPRSEEEQYMFAMQLAVSSVLPMAMQAVIELKVFEIIAAAGEGAQLSPVEIASHLTTKNPEAPAMLDRMLRLLANHSVLTRSVVTRKDGGVEKVYGLTPVCKYFIDNEDGISLAPYMFLCQDLVNMKAWYHTKDAVLEGGSPFEKVHGMNQYDYNNKDQRHNELFNKAMLAHTSNNLKKIVEVYKGFENLKEVIDVGGGIGTMSSLIYSKYPHIKCINYDLPHVIEEAPLFTGVKQVAGEMFVSVPSAETVFMKSVLHNWDDEDCVKVLKNSYEALPEQGTVIVVDILYSDEQEGMAEEDVLMMVMLSGGKERTLKEFEDLAKRAGFGSVKLVCAIGNYSVMEFYKVKAKAY